MSTYISRRRVVAGAAWAAPIIATSAAVPAFAASLDCVFAESPHKFLRGYSDYRVEEEFTVPANVHRIRFDIFWWWRSQRHRPRKRLGCPRDRNR